MSSTLPDVRESKDKTLKLLRLPLLLSRLENRCRIRRVDGEEVASVDGDGIALLQRLVLGAAAGDEGEGGNPRVLVSTEREARFFEAADWKKVAKGIDDMMRTLQVVYTVLGKDVCVKKKKESEKRRMTGNK